MHCSSLLKLSSANVSLCVFLCVCVYNWRRPTDITGVSPWIIECFCRMLGASMPACLPPSLFPYSLSSLSLPLITSVHISPALLLILLTYYSISLTPCLPPFSFLPLTVLVSGANERLPLEQPALWEVNFRVWEGIFYENPSAVKVFWAPAGTRKIGFGDRPQGSRTGYHTVA